MLNQRPGLVENLVELRGRVRVRVWVGVRVTVEVGFTKMQAAGSPCEASFSIAVAHCEASCSTVVSHRIVTYPVATSAARSA